METVQRRKQYALMRSFRRLPLLCLAAAITQTIHTARAADTFNADLVIYGGTSAGVIAAVQAKKLGKSVIVVGPDKHLGGLSSGGLGFTDTGNKAVIGGLARDFYHRVWKEYQKPETWRWQKQTAYGNKGQGTPAMDGVNRTMWIFEPSVAKRVFEDYVKEFGIPVHRDEWLGGGGCNAGHTIGATDELGMMAVDGKAHVRDFHVTLLRLLGLDNKLTFYHAGRFKQLSQFGGTVIKNLIA